MDGSNFQIIACRKCGEMKPEGEFYKSYFGKDGHGYACKECHKAAVKRWRQENPAAYRAHSAVSNAVRDGRIEKKPCEICGSEKVHAHHHDYARPLDVQWLCALHHHRLHADAGFEGANKKVQP